MESLNNCAKQYRVCLDYDSTLNCLVLTDNLGGTKPVKLPAGQVSATLQQDCILSIMVNNVETDTVDLTPILDKVANSRANLSWDPDTCVLSWVGVDGTPSAFDLSAILDKQNIPQERLTFDAATCALVWVDASGTPQTFDLSVILSKLVADSMAFDPNTCQLSFNPGGTGAQIFDLSPILDKYAVAYDPLTHELVETKNGVVSRTVINCASISLITTATACVLRYVDEKGVATDLTLPGVTMSRDAAACLITITDEKGNPFSFYEGPNPVTDIGIAVTTDRNIALTYKGNTFTAALPDFVTSLSFDTVDCMLKAFMWSGAIMPIDIFGVLGLTKNADGGFDVRLKDDICTFSPATLTVDPNNPNQYLFDNQFGQTATISVPTVDLDMDGATLTGPVLSLSFGGDGNTGTLNVNICDVVAQNCNASLTVNPDGSLTHVDNAGVITNVPAPVQNTDTQNTISSTDGSVGFTQTANPDGTINYDLSVPEDTNTQNTVSGGNNVTVSETPNADGTTNYEIAVPDDTNTQNTLNSTDGSVTFTETTNPDGTINYDLSAPDTNTQNTVSNTDGSITINETANADGTTDYELEVVNNVRNCDDSELEGPYKPLTVEQSHAPYIISAGFDPQSCGADDSCKPPVPVCPFDGMQTTTYNAHGAIQWTWFNGDWVDIYASTSSRTRCVINPTGTVYARDNANADPVLNLEQINEDNGTSGVVVDTISDVLVNDDCYPWLVVWDLRAGFNYQLRKDWRFSFDLTATAGVSNPMLSDRCDDGNVAVTFDTRQNEGTGFETQRVAGLKKKVLGILNPGDTSTVSYDLLLAVRNVGDANVNNLVAWQTTTLSATHSRFCG